MKKLIKFLTGRLFITCIFLLIQFLILFLVFYYLSNQIQYYYIGTIVASAILAITIANDDSNPSFKIAWIIPMLIFPLFGAPLYLIFSRSQVNYRINRRLKNYNEIVTKYLPIQNDVLDELWFEDPSIAKQFKYISQASFSPVYKNTLTQYFAFGQDFYVKAIEELEKAEKFIFLEYFIIDFGEMWSTILNILKRKSAQGVEIRLMYDDLGTIQLLPKDYPKKLETVCGYAGNAKRELSALGYRVYGDERLKISLYTLDCGLTGDETAQRLRMKNIECEYSDYGYVVLMPSADSKEEDFKRLVSALSFPMPKIRLMPTEFEGYSPKQALSPREAAFSCSETVDIENAVGRVCAKTVTACPPGVPIAVSGELIDENVVKIMKRYSFLTADVIK